MGMGGNLDYGGLGGTIKKGTFGGGGLEFSAIELEIDLDIDPEDGFGFEVDAFPRNDSIEMKWKGQFEQKGKSFPMECDHMESNHMGILEGFGSDAIGDFTIGGRVAETGVVSFIKKYLNGGQFLYKGKLDNKSKITGDWTFKGKDGEAQPRGKFHLKPDFKEFSGLYEKDGKQVEFELAMDLFEGQVTGGGVDSVGAFSIYGIYTDTEAWFLLCYFKAHKTQYKGQLVRDGKDIKIKGMWAIGQGGPNGKFVLNYGFDRTQFDKNLNFFAKGQGGPQQFPTITEETPRSTMSVDPGMGVNLNKSGYSDFGEHAPVSVHSHDVGIGAEFNGPKGGGNTDYNLNGPKGGYVVDVDFNGPKGEAKADYNFNGPKGGYGVDVDAGFNGPKGGGKPDYNFKGPKMGGEGDFELKGPLFEYEVELGADADINGPKGGGEGKADLGFKGPNLGYEVELEISGPNVDGGLGVNLGGEPQGNLEGMLTVKLAAAKMTYDGGTFGKMHPYTKVIVGGQKQKSKTHKSGGKNPVWNDTFYFRIQGETTIDFEVYDKEMVMSDD